jgi:hypothetical protein
VQDLAPTRLPAALGWHDPPVSETTGGRFPVETLVVVDVELVEDTVAVVVVTDVVGGVVGSVVEPPHPAAKRAQNNFPALFLMISWRGAHAHSRPRCASDARLRCS